MVCQFNCLWTIFVLAKSLKTLHSVCQNWRIFRRHQSTRKFLDKKFFDSLEAFCLPSSLNKILIILYCFFQFLDFSAIFSEVHEKFVRLHSTCVLYQISVESLIMARGPCCCCISDRSSETATQTVGVFEDLEMLPFEPLMLLQQSFSLRGWLQQCTLLVFQFCKPLFN